MYMVAVFSGCPIFLPSLSFQKTGSYVQLFSTAVALTHSQVGSYLGLGRRNRQGVSLSYTFNPEKQMDLDKDSGKDSTDKNSGKDSTDKAFRR